MFAVPTADDMDNEEFPSPMPPDHHRDSDAEMTKEAHSAKIHWREERSDLVIQNIPHGFLNVFCMYGFRQQLCTLYFVACSIITN